MTRLLAIGADGARGGWLTALAYGTSLGDVERVELQLAADFEALVALRTSAVPMAVDIPMGLLDTVALRPCDAKARELLGKRASTVFEPASRPLLSAVSHEEVRLKTTKARETDAAARGLSVQAYGIVPKMREADRFLQANPEAQEWLWEVHPELSFWAMPEGKVLRSKTSVGGVGERLKLLCDRFPGVVEALIAFEPGNRDAQMPDALDALVCLDTALHVATDDSEEFGGETDSTGLAMRMVV
jgi:predicted RNase H-like nuclease